MNTFEEAKIFFFISSVGFVILFALVAIVLFYSIQAFSAFSRIMKKLENNIDDIGDATTELLDEVKDSWIFHFFFRKSQKSKRTKK